MHLSTTIAKVALASLVCVLATAQTHGSLPPPPTLYWDHKKPTPPFVLAPLPSMHFSWRLRWDASNSTAWVVGTFNYSTEHGYVGVGTRSPRGMDGLNIICHANAAMGTARCDDWVGSWYDIDKAARSETRVLSARIIPGAVSQVVFERVAFENGSDLGLFTWGSAERVIWAYGPMEDEDEAGDHPGEGIASGLLDFLTGEHPERENPGTHLVPVWVGVGFLVIVILVVWATILTNVRVHHIVRDGFGWAVTLVYLALFVWFIVAAIDDYTAIAKLGPVARAMGDGAAAALAFLLLSGTRRVLPQDLLTVSHERMIVYHTLGGLAFVGCLAGHAVAMVEFYFLPYAFRWAAAEPFPKLPGTIAAVLTVFVVLPAVLRFHISYRWFRILHWLWVPVTVMTILHVPRLLWACLPGLVCITLNFIFGRIANCGSRVEAVTYDRETMTVTLDMSRPYYRLLATGDAADMGIAPAQWFYLGQFGLSLVWHPFSVARAEVIVDANGRPRQHLRFVIKETHGLAGGGGPVTTAINAALSAVGAREKADKLRGFGSWTTKVWRAATTSDEPTAALGGMWLEGPFGRLQMPLRAYRNLIFISGGIGVTPNLLTLQYVASISTQCVAEGRPAPWDSVLWTWASREASMFALFSEDLASYQVLLKKAGVNLVMRNFCTGTGPGLAESAAGLPFDVMIGQRPDYDVELRTFAGTCSSSSTHGSDNSCAAMYSCGPLPMIDAAANAAKAANAAAKFSIHHHTEVFDV